MYLSKFGFVIKKTEISNEELINLKKELIAKPVRDDKYNIEDINYPIFNETINKIYIPKMFGKERYGNEVEVKEMKNYIGKDWEKSIEFKGELYPEQKEPVDKILNVLFDTKKGGGILQLPTGFGKSIALLYILTKLKKKAIIIVNKIQLLNQWKSEINKFLPEASVGMIQGKITDVKDKDIVVAMIHSISLIDYPKEIFEEFGVSVIDEIHNTASKMFSKTLFKTCCKYTIGLSATPKRSDRCEKVFKYHIGEIEFEKHFERRGKIPIIRTIKMTSDKYKEIKRKEYSGKEVIMFTSMITELIKMKERNDYITQTLIECANEGRKVLLLSERREHLLIIKELLDKNEVKFTYGLFMGAMKNKDLDVSKKCDVILSTYSAFSEGVSVAQLDTLILATPKKYIKNNSNDNKKQDSGKMNQIVGRIFRKEHIDKNPLIIDLFDDFSVYSTQGKSRKVFYKGHFSESILEEKTVVY